MEEIRARAEKYIKAEEDLVDQLKIEHEGMKQPNSPVKDEKSPNLKRSIPHVLTGYTLSNQALDGTKS
ncbi:hypothetical protein CR513_31294, partial [Mucuna pruriens]